MMSRQVCLMALCSLLIITMSIDSTQSASCCLRYIRYNISCKRLLDFSMQTINRSCDMEAVIFRTRSRFLCADPASRATQRGVQCVRERRRRKAADEAA